MFSGWFSTRPVLTLGRDGRDSGGWSRRSSGSGSAWSRISRPSPVRARQGHQGRSAGISQRRLARRARSWRPIRVGGSTLADAASDRQVMQLISSVRWDAVVLQDLSRAPALPALRTSEMLPAVAQFDALIRAAGAVPVLFETWATATATPPTSLAATATPLCSAVRTTVTPWPDSSTPRKPMRCNGQVPP
jgi:hypothetical protein